MCQIRVLRTRDWQIATRFASFLCITLERSMNLSNWRRLILVAILGSIAPVADAHSFEWVPNVIGGTLLVQLIPLLWVLRWRTSRFTIWFLVSILVSWPIAVSAVLFTNSTIPACLLAAPWVVSFFFGFVHERSNNSLKSDVAKPHALG